jgi:hypothetical protein
MGAPGLVSIRMIPVSTDQDDTGLYWKTNGTVRSGKIFPDLIIPRYKSAALIRSSLLAIISG